MRAIWMSALLLCAACAGAPHSGASTAAEAPPSPHADLETIFWHCDYVATTRGIDATPIRECAAATRELRQVKFAGSFHRLLEWWRDNKVAEHTRIRRMRREPAL